MYSSQQSKKHICTLDKKARGTYVPLEQSKRHIRTLDNKARGT